MWAEVGFRVRVRAAGGAREFTGEYPARAGVAPAANLPVTGVRARSAATRRPSRAHTQLREPRAHNAVRKHMVSGRVSSEAATWRRRQQGAAELIAELYIHVRTDGLTGSDALE